MTADLEFTNLLLVAAVAFTAPLLLGLAPKVRGPAVVLEIVLGITLGPAGLGWIDADAPVRVLALLGLAFLLFLAGLELEPESVRGPVARLAAVGFAVSAALALAAALVLEAAGVADD